MQLWSLSLQCCWPSRVLCTTSHLVGCVCLRLCACMCVMPASLPSRAQQPVLLPFSFQPALCTVRISVALPDGFLPSALLYMSSQLSMHSNNLLALACILLTSQLWTKLLLRYFPVRNSAESQCLCVSCCLTLHLGLICALHLLRYRCSKWVYCRSFICLLSFLAVRFTFISFKLVTLTHFCPSLLFVSLLSPSNL